MCIEKWCSAIQAPEPDAFRIHHQFFVKLAIEPRHAANSFSRSPDDIDRVCGLIEGSGTHFRLPDELRKLNDITHDDGLTLAAAGHFGAPARSVDVADRYREQSRYRRQRRRRI
ncbi:hypothetical protein D3C87_1812410 [compost metagenome]